MSEKNYEWRTSVTKILIALILSLIFFNTVKINLCVFFIVFAFLWTVVIINNRISDNIKLYDSLVLISLGILASIIALQYAKKIETDVILFGFIGMYVVFLAIVSIYSWIKNSKEEENKVQRPLRKRQRDLERLLSYVEMFEIIALNGRWGTGKTFLVNELKKNPQIMQKYEIIEIDVLTCDLNELLLILVKEIERLLFRNRIVSRYSIKLKEILGSNKFLVQFQSLFLDGTQSFAEAIKGIQNEISRLEKDVLIIYEDIDRINDVNIIKKIFSINERLSNERIKIIYQYHEDNLKNMGFTDDYLEKYLPYKLNVTESDLFETIIFILQKDKIEESLLKIEDFNFLRKELQATRTTFLNSYFDIGIEIYLQFNNLPFRKVENFCFELVSTLKKYDYKENKETVIVFFVVKHFITPIYEQFTIERGLLEAITFDVGGKYYSLAELRGLRKQGELWTYQLQKIIDVEENKAKFGVLNLFNYENIEINDDVPSKEKWQSIIEESDRLIIQRISNEKKDQIIWNLLAAGKSELTDYEFCGRMLVERVFSKPEEKREEAYKVFRQFLFNLDKNEFDNGTMFLFGIPPFIQLFKAFRTLADGDQYVKELVDLYFDIEKIDSIDEKVIRTLNYVLLPNIDAYVHILKKFNQLKIKGNLNLHAFFATFVNKLLCEALANLGFMNAHRYFGFSSGTIDSVVKEPFVGDLNKIKLEIITLQKNLYKFIKYDNIDEDISVIIEFVEKLIEIIEFPSELQVSDKPFNMETTFGSRFVNQEEFDRLKQLLEDKSGNVTEEIVKSYQLGKITPFEIEKLGNKNELDQ